MVYKRLLCLMNWRKFSIVVLVVALTDIVFAGQTIYVDPNSPAPHNGLSWNTAYNYLQDALASAVSGDEIRVSQGIHYPDRSSAHPAGSRSRTATFQLIAGTTVKGGYAGYGQIDPNMRDMILYNTVLSGDVNDNDDPNFTNNEPNFINYDDNSYRVVTFSVADANAVLDGLTIRSGNCNGDNPYDRGAAVYNDRGRITLLNCTICYNQAKGEDSGRPGFCSGIYNYKGVINLTGCMISNNLAVGYEGGGAGGPVLYSYNGTFNLTDCNFVENVALGGDGGGEAIGCIYSNTPNATGDSYMTLNNCIFSGNQAVGGDGGGLAIGCIYNFGWRNSEAILAMTGCNFLGNQAIAGNWGGEAIGCILNKASQSSAFAHMTLNGCNFSGNQAMTDDGYVTGAIKNYASYDSTRAYLTMISCIVTDNSTTINWGHPSKVGFIHNDALFDRSESHATMINCTVANNKPVVDSGFTDVAGVYNDEGWYGGQPIFRIENTILAGHFEEGTTTWMGHDAYGFFEEDSKYNFVGLANPGLGNIESGLGTIYGTMECRLDPCFVNPDANDYHLKSQAGRWDSDSQTWVQDSLTSRCIDAGNPGFPIGDEPADTNNVRINMGAYGGTIEASKTPADFSLLADLTNDGIADYLDLYHWSDYWLGVTELLPSDLNRDGKTNLADYCLFAQDWLKQPSWH